MKVKCRVKVTSLKKLCEWKGLITKNVDVKYESLSRLSTVPTFLFWSYFFFKSSYNSYFFIKREDKKFMWLNQMK